MRKTKSKIYHSSIFALCFLFMAVLFTSGRTVGATVNPVKAYVEKNSKKLYAASIPLKNKKDLAESTASIDQQTKAVDVVKYDQLAAPIKGEEIAVIKTKLGVIKLKLLSNYAPKAVEIFKNRVNSGFYNGLSFNKLMGNSIVQGGTNTQNTTINTTPNVNLDEYNADIRNYRGAVSVASGDVGSIDQFVIIQAGSGKIVKDTLNFMKSTGESQFSKQVINKYKQNGGAPWLDYHNVIFGQVYAGMNIVDKIAKLAVDENNWIKKEVKITSITIETTRK